MDGWHFRHYSTPNISRITFCDHFVRMPLRLFIPHGFDTHTEAQRCYQRPLRIALLTLMLFWKAKGYLGR